MSEKEGTEGTLRKRPSGQWAIQVTGREPVNILAGEIFAVQMPGRSTWQRVRMERRDGEWCAMLSEGRAVRRIELRDGARAGFFDQRERYAKALGP